VNIPGLKWNIVEFIFGYNYRIIKSYMRKSGKMRRKDRDASDIKLIEDIIRKADVCRLAFANGNTPYIVTMNFGYSGIPDQNLFFHCAREGKKLDMIRNNNYVCFEMDTDHEIFSGPKGCDWGMKYSSVVGYGIISIITDEVARKTGLKCIMSHYENEKEYSFDDKVLAKTTILRLDITEMTGKKC
jgi:nitroimidazol reductase NimA-like FMN-containing flavoprotein (pyridoxamine 5'-phosphate oxidase superfamily)